MTTQQNQTQSRVYLRQVKKSKFKHKRKYTLEIEDGNMLSLISLDYPSLKVFQNEFQKHLDKP